MSEERPYGPSVVGGKLFFKLLDDSSICCNCIAEPFASQVVAACRYAKRRSAEQYDIDLGFDMTPSVTPWSWGMEVRDGDGNILAVAFSEEQAREIARRINKRFPPE